MSILAAILIAALSSIGFVAILILLVVIVGEHRNSIPKRIARCPLNNCRAAGRCIMQGTDECCAMRRWEDNR